MKRSETEVLLYSLTAYLGASMLATVLLLLGSLAAMKVFFIFARFAFGPEEVYWIKPLLYDSIGFALASSGTALAQYYLVSLLCRFVTERAVLSLIVSFTALFCGLFFWRGALSSSLGSYGFSGLAVTLAALLGGLEAVFQEPDSPQRRRGRGVEQSNTI
ncbi:MAG: hypothetical protein Q7R35_02685 [Elusimicrobiota bacterium]|nr:hypothetical protein [Elusimicrobiota bacterium]